MLEIRRIEGRRELRRFVEFAIDLYRGSEYYIPPIISMEVDMHDPAKNPAFQFCDSVYMMAYRDGKAVGRIAGFVNHRSNQKYGNKVCRFCWIDFIDDEEVSRFLLDNISQWGREKGMDKLVGPLAPTDIDNEGVLIEGFDQLPTTVNTYNYPYYERHFVAYGMNREATWYEFRMDTPKFVPERHLRMAQIVKDRYGLRVFTELDSKKFQRQWGKKLFELMNQSYANIYGFTELTEAQVDYYIKLYLPQVPLSLIRLVADKDDNLIAFGLSIPSLSRAQQRAKGHLFPFGWIYLLRALYVKGATDTIDFLLMGVRPDYQGKGVNSLIFCDLIPEYQRWGFKYMETNAELVNNKKIQNVWSEFNPRHHKTRCTFTCPL